jgi:hypothetical protein
MRACVFDVLAAPAVQLGSDSRELIGLTPFTPPPPHYYSEGVGVELAPALARARPLIKTADFAQARQAYPAGQSQAAYEYLLVSADGRILEGTGTNFWAVRDGVVWAAGAGVLEGVTRKIILGLLPELGIPARLERWAWTRSARWTRRPSAAPRARCCRWCGLGARRWATAVPDRSAPVFWRPTTRL